MRTDCPLVLCSCQCIAPQWKSLFSAPLSNFNQNIIKERVTHETVTDDLLHYYIVDFNIIIN